MKIELLKLLNFRNYQQLEISFHPSLNVIYGKNGSGKTNLVEAIYVLGLTRSFRLSQEKTLILDGAISTKVEGVIRNRYKTTYTVLLNKEAKKVMINDNKVGKLSDYISKITIVLFHPDDLRFIKDTPSTRRKNLNISISEMNLDYLRVLNLYNKILKQRNAYLKQMIINHHETTSYLDILTSKLVDAGLYIYQKRKTFLEKVNSYLARLYFQITGLEGLEIVYRSSYEKKSKEEILQAMQSGLEKDLMLGKTSIGIHGDDLAFLLKGKDLKEYGSEGQKKNAIIAYKFSELEIFKEKTGYYPIFILDDLFSELDQEKVQNILRLLSSDVQTFITTTSLGILSSFENHLYKQIHIEDGHVIGESEENGK
ncbi:MAG: DNA replication/repair protein RecF [Bacilli bacterium]|nr:DNA replication/repair protein RecF [Bacilli bacterium]